MNLQQHHGVTVRLVLTDNAMTYRHGIHWAAVCAALQIRRRFAKPRHPWTNGKAERFDGTLQTEWAYSKAWTSDPTGVPRLPPGSTTTPLNMLTPPWPALTPQAASSREQRLWL